MNANEVKPGTRCECPGVKNRPCSGCSPSSSKTYCRAAAVRLVTVSEQRNDPSIPILQLPMCAACAEYHEGGAK